MPRSREYLLLRHCDLRERGFAHHFCDRPDGTLLCYQPYGKHGLLLADLDLTEATGLLASRCKSQ